MEPTKYCPTCKSIKFLFEFYNDKSKRDGKRFECKVCKEDKRRLWRIDHQDVRYKVDKEKVRVYTCIYREEHKEEIKARKSQWRKDHLEEERERHKKYWLEHPERAKEVRKENKKKYKKRYPEKLAARKRAHRKRWKARSPEKFRAHKTLQRAVKSGRLTREPCFVCGNPVSEGHHPDYSKPLEVLWLCSVHHWEEHNRIEKESKP